MKQSSRSTPAIYAGSYSKQTFREMAPDIITYILFSLLVEYTFLLEEKMCFYRIRDSLHTSHHIAETWKTKIPKGRIQAFLK